MKKREKILYSEATVRFQDCDPYSLLYNSKYLDYFLNAREDQLLAYYDFDIYALARNEGLGWVIAQNQIAYLYPALLMEQVAISSRLIDFSARKLRVEFMMKSKDRDKTKALMWTDFVHYDLGTKKSTEHDNRFMDLFHEVHYPVPEESFPERVNAIRKNNAL